MGKHQERECPLVHSLRVVHPPLQDAVLKFFHESLFLRRVGDRMSSHVEQEEILLLSGQDALLNEVFCDPFSDISQLILQLEGIPGLTYSEKKERGL